MDKLDKKILAALMQNARQPITQLAKKLKISREVATYRIRKLQERGVIKAFITKINAEQLGYTYASLFLTLKAGGEQAFKEYIKTCPFAAWTSAFAGTWNLGVGIYGKNIEEIHHNFTTIHKQFKEYIIDHRLTIHKHTAQFYEKYIGASKHQRPKKSSAFILDDKDKRILKLLAQDARLDTVTLADDLDLSAPAVAKRIKKLEQAGYIEGYSLFLDPASLGLYQFSIFITNRNKDYKDISAYLAAHPNVSFIITYIGDPFLEFGIIVDDPFKMRSVLQEIASAFPDNKVTETFLIQDEILSIGLPACVFD